MFLISFIMVIVVNKWLLYPINKRDFWGVNQIHSTNQCIKWFTT